MAIIGDHKKIHETEKVIVYSEKITLAKVNCDYTHTRKPLYYLKQNNQYISGLFKTETPGLFSADYREPGDPFKTFLKVEITPSTITIQEGKVK